VIGFVLVSHSAKLAEGVCELAEQVAQGKVRIAPAGGTSDPGHPIGTDAFKVLQAIETVYSEEGVLVFMDLGSAVLSAETALELLDPDKRANVHLCTASLVEGTVAAVSQAAAGAGLAEVLHEAQGAPTVKVAQTELAPSADRLITLPNRLGLHARPAAQLIRLARRFQSRITLENVTTGTGPYEVSGINAVLSLGARQGHQLRLRAWGPDAQRSLAELAAFVESGCGDNESESPVTLSAPAPVAAAHGELAGIPASAGIAIGPLVKLQPAAVAVTARTIPDTAAESQRLLAALDSARRETQSLYDWAKTHAGQKEAGIFDAQLLFLEDPSLTESATQTILTDRVNAEFAWQTAASKAIDRLGALEDPYLRARAADVADVAARVLRPLAGTGSTLPTLHQPSILTALDLTPSDVRTLDPALVLGLCLESGSVNAHSTILVRAMGIPAVVGLGPAIASIAEGTTVALDGALGRVYLSPDPEQVQALNERREAWLAAQRTAQLERHKPACTRDSHRIRVYANLNAASDAAEAIEYGAEGAGLLRTEFLFLGAKVPPSEDEQFTAYRAAATTLGPRPLVIRTLDIGGDKKPTYLEIPSEANPELGWRGIRLTLSLRDLFRTQLRAILRAAEGQSISIMFPMVSSVEELREAKKLLAEAASAVDSKVPPVGIMIEVPAAVAIADQLAREVDFFSIGSNDLTQYVMAADRTNPRVSALADSLQPAVLRMIHETIQAARKAGIEVALCGELAGDPLAAPLLLGLGLEEFSASPRLIPALKQAIARWTLPEAKTLADEALTLDSAQAVRDLLRLKTPAGA
jgi:phosphocarrier protein FPr